MPHGALVRGTSFFFGNSSVPLAKLAEVPNDAFTFSPRGYQGEAEGRPRGGSYLCSCVLVRVARRRRSEAASPLDTCEVASKESMVAKGNGKGGEPRPDRGSKPR